LLLIGGFNRAFGSDPKMQIHVIFLGTFEDENVQLYSAERQLFSLYLHTEPTSGTAGYAEVTALAPGVKIRVAVPRLKATKEMLISPSNGSYLYVTLANDQLSFEQSKTPFALD
jgi:hypothetical protein